MYWEYNGNRFYNQLSAHKAARGEHTNFCLPDTFDNFDFEYEPSETWKECLLNHALFLRKKYDHLRIWYTGGVDSQTVLNTFYENDIFIDEIAIIRYCETGDPKSLSNSEVTRVATPFVNSIKKDIPLTKISYYDIDKEMLVDFYNDFENGYISGNMTYPWFTPSSISYRLREIKDNLSTCNIIGSEKPRISMDENGYYAYIIDKTVSQHLVDPSEFNIDHFFLNEKIYAKQCHLLKNHIQTTRNYKLLDFHNYWQHLNEINSICRDPLYINFSFHKSLNLGDSLVFRRMQISENTTWEILKKYGLSKDKFDDMKHDLSSACHISIKNAEKDAPELIPIYLSKLEEINDIYVNQIGALNYLNNKKNIYGGRVGVISKKYYLEHV